jgi:hypothetical protein
LPAIPTVLAAAAVIPMDSTDITHSKNRVEQDFRAVAI